MYEYVFHIHTTYLCYCTWDGTANTLSAPVHSMTYVVESSSKHSLKQLMKFVRTSLGMSLFTLSFAFIQRTPVSLRSSPLRSFSNQPHFGYATGLERALAASPSSNVNESRLFSTEESSGSQNDTSVRRLSDDVPLYLAEGLFAVNKPLNWTSSNVVSVIRRTLEKDTKKRGGTVAKVFSKGKRKIRVGHGGTLDPLATGVLVIGVGKGTKELQSYLSGSKRYSASGEFGYETTTLDAEGEVTKTAPYDHITAASIEEILPLFTGEIMQVPPIFSALKKGGKALYKLGREGVSAEDIDLQPRPVKIYELKLVNPDDSSLPRFDIAMESGGGTYVRSLIRDIAYQLDCVATTTVLTRTQHGPFTMDDVVDREDWSPENIYAAIEKFNSKRDEMVESNVEVPGATGSTQ